MEGQKSIVKSTLNIKEVLLNKKNQSLCQGIALGERICATGKDHLWSDRKSGIIDVVIVHYISASKVEPLKPFDTDEILKIFCDFRVSSHYLIGRLGGIIRLVPEQKRAWHCGGSIMPEPDLRTGVNDFSIGIELAATDSSGFTLSQYRSLSLLCNDIEIRYGKEFVYAGHDQVAGNKAVELGLRDDPKIDPGPLFDWFFFNSSIEELRSARQTSLP